MQNETPNQQWENESKEEPKTETEQESPAPIMENAEPAPAAPVIPPEQAEQPATSAAAEPVLEPVISQLPKESGFKRFLRFLFGPDTRVGKFMRPFLRGMAGIVIAFAAGMLAAYYILYLPLHKEYINSLSAIQQMNTTMQENQTQVASLEGEITAMQATMAGMQAENELANYKVNYLIVKNDVMRAKLALVDGSTGPGGPATMAALDDLDKHLTDLLPYIKVDDPVLADLLTSRLDVVQSEMARDAEQARLELEKFDSELSELEASLFEQQ